ncbi:MAG: DUF2934 domain-containing protein [Candidatus Omnitrophica bacterium]|nr:DUF2934 domain-containing protein [Candidatus Omnitrophota bacterium]
MAEKRKTVKKAKSPSKKRTTKKKSPTGKKKQKMIEKKAYELYASRGYQHGNDQADWYEAERIVAGSKK